MPLMWTKIFPPLRTMKSNHPSAGRKPFRPVLETLEDRRLLARVRWDCNCDGNFHDASKWLVEGSSPPEHRVPGPTDDAVIPNSIHLAVTVTYSAASGNRQVRSLTTAKRF